ncbi:MAG: PAS domain-containing protein [Hoeflea sp.]|uniref:PAS domain-containing protein n=1 Tax=Hoeflea sp. TaxID=1940281 RepID=UPI003EF6CF00
MSLGATQTTEKTSFLSGGGNAGELIRAYDWRNSPLGPAENWPESLKTVVAILLGSSQPMFVAWGESRTLIYNDPYAEILAEKHPALGLDFLEAWHEIRADLQPIVTQAYRGEPVQMDDIELIMHRKGYPEETHFSFFYSPVRVEGGAIGGLFCACTEITRQVLADRQAAADRNRQQLMLQQMPGFVAVLTGSDHRFEYVNDAFVALAGEREFHGRPAREVFPEVASQGFFELLDRVYANGEAYSDRAAPLGLSNQEEELFVDLLFYPIRDNSDAVTGIFVGGYDVSDRLRTEQRLRASEARFRAVQETSVDGFMLLDSVRNEKGEIVDFRWAYANDASARIIGRRRDWFIGRRLLEEFPGNRENGMFDIYVQVAETGEPWADELNYRQDGLDVFVRIVVAKVDDGIAASFADLSDRRRAEERMREASERVQLALDAGAIIGTWVWEVPTDHFTADERFARSFALDPDRLRAGIRLQDAVQSIHPEDQARVGEAISEAMGRGGPYRCEYRVLQLDGNYRWIEANGRVELGADGTPRRFPGVLLDIEHRRAIEAERDRAAALLRTFTEAVPGVAFAKDREGRMLVANRGATELIGKPPEEYLGKTDVEFLDDEEQGRAIMATDRRIMETGRSEQVEEEVRLPDGTPAIWLSTKAPMKDEDGTVIGLIGSSIDITARRRAEEALRELNETLEARVNQAVAKRQQAEEALRQSQKLESMGQLTGGVAHDFNNLLTPIIGGLDMLQRRQIGDDRTRRLIDGALQSAERAKTLVQRLLAFARRQPLQPTAVNLVGLVEGLSELVASTLGPRVKLIVEIAAGTPPVKADPNQLEMAILNLVVNTRDAMPDGGTLTIAAVAETVQSGHRTNLPPGAYVRLAVSDTGTGMDEATRARAIEPFFSTKGIGRGTGLGLSMVHGLTEQLGGRLTIDSRIGLGTTVKLWLPVVEDAVEPVAATPETVRLAGAGIALLIDDEELVRASTADMLVQFGYDVIETSSAEDALARMDAGLVPDLVVTDHLMPGMTGTDFLRMLKVRWPEIPALVVSGYSEDDGIAPDLPRLTKPFREADLATSLAELTGQKGNVAGR